LYSQYDALVSIAVPLDKARAVVDAMEHDMGSTLATKQALSRLAIRDDLLTTSRKSPRSRSRAVVLTRIDAT
jgi:hypothetical protein